MRRVIAAVIAAAVLVTSISHCDPERSEGEAISEIASSLSLLAMTKLAPESRIETSYKKLTGKGRVGRRVKALRRLDGLTTAEVAQAAGIKEARLIAIEDKNKKEFPTAQEISQLAKALEVLPEFLTMPWWDSFASRMRRVFSLRSPQTIDSLPKGVRRNVIALILRKGPHGYEVLLTKRSEEMEDLPGYWVAPGGGRKQNAETKDGLELISKAASRETWEETDVLLLKENILGRMDDYLTLYEPKLITPVVVLVPQGTPYKKSKEVEDGEWFPLERLSEPDLFQHLEMQEKKMQIDGRTQMILMQFNEIVREANGAKKTQPAQGCTRWNLKGRNSWEKVFEREYAVTPDNLNEILNDPLRLLFLPPNLKDPYPITREKFNEKVNEMIRDAAGRGKKVVVRITLTEEGVLAEVGADSCWFPWAMPTELPAISMAGPFAFSMEDIPPSEMLLGCIISWFAVVIIAIFAPDIRAAFSYVRQGIASLASWGQSSEIFLHAIRPALEKKGFSGIELIGEGSNAYVYKASYKGRYVALRVEKVSGERTRKERTALGGNLMRWILRKGHPGIVRLYGAGDIKANYKGRNRKITYHVLEYVNGKTISQLKAEGYFKKAGFYGTLGIVVQILEGLNFIHTRGLYYGAMNSSTNVMIDDSGLVKIIDIVFHKPLPVQVGYRHGQDLRAASYLLADMLYDGSVAAVDADALTQVWFDDPAPQDKEAARRVAAIIEQMRGEEPPKSRLLRTRKYLSQVLRGSDSSAKLPKIIEELKGIANGAARTSLLAPASRMKTPGLRERAERFFIALMNLALGERFNDKMRDFTAVGEELERIGGHADLIASLKRTTKPIRKFQRLANEVRSILILRLRRFKAERRSPEWKGALKEEDIPDLIREFEEGAEEFQNAAHDAKLMIDIHAVRLREEYHEIRNISWLAQHHLIDLQKLLLNMSEAVSEQVRFAQGMMSVEVLDFKDALKGLQLEGFAEHVKERGVKLDVELPGEGILVRASKRTLLLAVKYLVDNRLNGAYEARRTQTKSSIRLFADNSNCYFEISDNGLSVPDGLKDRIFDLDFALRSSGKNADIGLVIARLIVRDHGGDITFHNNPSSGATFTMRLPRAVPASVPVIGGLEGRAVSAARSAALAPETRFEGAALDLAVEREFSFTNAVLAVIALGIRGILSFGWASGVMLGMAVVPDPMDGYTKSITWEAACAEAVKKLPVTDDIKRDVYAFLDNNPPFKLLPNEAYFSERRVRLLLGRLHAQYKSWENASDGRVSTYHDIGRILLADSLHKYLKEMGAMTHEVFLSLKSLLSQDVFLWREAIRGIRNKDPMVKPIEAALTAVKAASHPDIIREIDGEKSVLIGDMIRMAFAVLNLALDDLSKPDSPSSGPIGVMSLLPWLLQLAAVSAAAFTQNWHFTVGLMLAPVVVVGLSKFDMQLNGNRVNLLDAMIKGTFQLPWLRFFVPPPLDRIALPNGQGHYTIRDAEGISKRLGGRPLRRWLLDKLVKGSHIKTNGNGGLLAEDIERFMNTRTLVEAASLFKIDRRSLLKILPKDGAICMGNEWFLSLDWIEGIRQAQHRLVPVKLLAQLLQQSGFKVTTAVLTNRIRYPERAFGQTAIEKIIGDSAGLAFEKSLSGKLHHGTDGVFMVDIVTAWQLIQLLQDTKRKLDGWYTINSLAEKIGVSRNIIQLFVCDGRIEAEQVLGFGGEHRSHRISPEEAGRVAKRFDEAVNRYKAQLAPYTTEDINTWNDLERVIAKWDTTGTLRRHWQFRTREGIQELIARRLLKGIFIRTPYATEGHWYFPPQEVERLDAKYRRRLAEIIAFVGRYNKHRITTRAGLEGIVKNWVTLSEFAFKLGKTDKVLLHHIKRGNLAAVKMDLLGRRSRSRLIPPQEAKRWLELHPVSAARNSLLAPETRFEGLEELITGLYPHGMPEEMIRNIRAHAENVAAFSRCYAEAIPEISGDESLLEVLRIIALAHDLGKASSPEMLMIINSKRIREKLSDAERELLKAHPVHSVEMFKRGLAEKDIRLPAKTVEMIMEAILNHHNPERINGSTTKLLAQIILAADHSAAHYEKHLRRYKTRRGAHGNNHARISYPDAASLLEDLNEQADNGSTDERVCRYVRRLIEEGDGNFSSIALRAHLPATIGEYRQAFGAEWNRVNNEEGTTALGGLQWDWSKGSLNRRLRSLPEALRKEMIGFIIRQKDRSIFKDGYAIDGLMAFVERLRGECTKRRLPPNTRTFIAAAVLHPLKLQKVGIENLATVALRGGA